MYAGALCILVRAIVVMPVPVNESAQAEPVADALPEDVAVIEIVAVEVYEEADTA